MLRSLTNNKYIIACIKKSARFASSPHTRVLLQYSRVPLITLALATTGPTSVVRKDASMQTEKDEVFIPRNINIPKVLEDADSFFREGKFNECVELLQNFIMIEDPEICWRLARGLYNLTKIVNGDKKRKCINDGYELMKSALEKWPDNGAIHKWYAVLLDSYAGLQGVKERVRQCKTVKEHMMKATELNPSDATAWYMLGEWCYHVADISWHERKLAIILFGEPPYSTFEEALRYFQKAEETEPLFYSNNLLMLGKTYYRLGKTEPALFYLQKAQLHPKTCDDDMIACNEATKLLCKLKKNTE
ncbi:regulator of microtubule dynamics protein 1-like [Ctenocephalides felis]|uniref:regulator of microtubule dynamics protein 1-like n=1 Tax=Ctenocephalides felis TaxID=7515 RepID=UPI000E6E1CCE|nr:regulator of microtubule dynamics protein 1-like [Ctenocephalides felis]XP_026474926.1 regulator of microtubule dynamics protein 1-like [Ctenocephalides felis]